MFLLNFCAQKLSDSGRHFVLVRFPNFLTINLIDFNLAVVCFVNFILNFLSKEKQFVNFSNRFCFRICQALSNEKEVNINVRLLNKLYSEPVLIGI